jgi:hypothetical protein
MLPLGGLHDLPLTTELSRPEVSTFLVLFTAPHLMLGLACLLLAAAGYLASWRRGGLVSIVATGAATLGVGLTNPFGLVTLGGVLAGHLGLAVLCGPRPPRAAVLGALLAGVCAAPFLLYNLLVFGADPFWGVVYGKQNVIPTPPAPFLAMGFAPVLVLAALGLPRFVARRDPGHRLVVVWIVLCLALICAPTTLGYQRRFVFGVQPMLAIVAVAALQRLLAWARRADSPWCAVGRRTLRNLALITLFGSSVCLYGAIFQIVARPAAGHGGAFQPRAIEEAGRWLAGRMSVDDVVVADGMTGNYLAGVIPGRAYAGHQVGTLDLEGKLAAERQFYLAASAGSAERFLVESGARYVVYGPYERALGGASPADLPLLHLVYDTPEVRIYAVNGAQLRAQVIRVSRVDRPGAGV